MRRHKMMKPEEHKKHGEAKVISNVERAWCFGGLTAGDDYFEGFEKAAFTLNGGEDKEDAGNDGDNDDDGGHG